MKKSKGKNFLSGWKFEAIRKRRWPRKDVVLSTLIGAIYGVPGECNLVNTNPGSKRCGLATALMKFCFTDPDVGSLNPETSMYVLTSL